MKKIWYCCLLSITGYTATAQWNPGTTINKPVCTVAANQSGSEMVKDDSGGYIVIWVDNRNGLNNRDIYAQRISASGADLWGPNGIPVCTAANDQYLPAIVADGSGGAIISWADQRNSGNIEIYAQKLGNNGIAQWATNGVNLCNATNGVSPVQVVNYETRIVSDGAGGAMMCWSDIRNNNPDVYAQRVNAAGVAQWTANGVVICNAPGQQINLGLVPDGAGGVYLSWTDKRSSTYDVYLQRINGLGVPQFTANGLAVCTAPNEQFYASLVNDGLGNAIVGWEDFRNGHDDIFVQKVSSAGVIQWAANGLPVCLSPGQQYGPYMIPDNNGGAILCWQDHRADVANPDIYAQRVSGTGSMLWPVNGLVICNDLNRQELPAIVTDGNGGCIIAWADSRPVSMRSDVYAQQVSATGIPQWTANGVAVSDAPMEQMLVRMVERELGGAFITWTDFRNGEPDIYTAALESTGVPLSLNLLNFEAQLSGQEVFIDWSVAASVAADKFIIERSRDGKHFVAIGHIDPVQGKNGIYNYIDKYPLAGTSFYRLQMVVPGAALTFSSIEKIYNATGTVPLLYPNPADDQISIRTRGNEGYILISDIQGRILKSVKVSGEDMAVDISDLTTGSYWCKVGQSVLLFVKK